MTEAEYEEQLDDDIEINYAEADIDPLDAQTLGHHERDYDLGHEEIRLNLEDDAVPLEAEHTEPHAPTRETPHTT
jgi:hypothetical protein